jgi:hypothetical protein
VGRTGWALTRGGAPQNGWTPLHCAAIKGHPEVARALLEARADITAKDNVSGRWVGMRRAGDSREQRFRVIVTDLGGDTHTHQDETTALCSDR